MPTNVPRTQTGLVPTTYQKKLNRICSPENWRRLPPRPAPERYQFRGVCTNKEGVPSNVNGKKGIQKRLQNRKTSSKCRSSEGNREGTTNQATQKRPLLPWDDCMRDVTVSPTLELDKKAHPRLNEETDRNSKDLTSLEYLRKSGEKRRQLRDLQKRLDAEIEEENRLYGLDEKYNTGGFYLERNDKREKSASKLKYRSHQAEDCDNTGRPTQLIEEMNRIKTSLLNRLELECDSHSKGSPAHDEESLTNSTEKDQKRKNYTKQFIIQYSLGDASTLDSLETSNSSLTDTQLPLPTTHQRTTGSFDGVTRDLEYVEKSSCNRLVAPQDELGSPFLAKPREKTDHSSLSTTSTWDDLSHDQHERIKLRAEELYRSKYKSRIPSINNNTPFLATNKDTSVFKKVLKPSEPIVSNQASIIRNTSKENDSLCVKNLVAAITKGLCSAPELKDKDNIVFAKASEEPITSLEDIEDGEQLGSVVSTRELEAMPLPRHPYELPLENQFRKSMKNMKITDENKVDVYYA